MSACQQLLDGRLVFSCVNEPFDLCLWAEVENEADLQTSCAKGIQSLCHMVALDGRQGFQFNQYFVRDDQVGAKCSDRSTSKNDRQTYLLCDIDFSIF